MHVDNRAGVGLVGSGVTGAAGLVGSGLKGAGAWMSEVNGSIDPQPQTGLTFDTYNSEPDGEGGREHGEAHELLHLPGQEVLLRLPQELAQQLIKPASHDLCQAIACVHGRSLAGRGGGGRDSGF